MKTNFQVYILRDMSAAGDSCTFFWEITWQAQGACLRHIDARPRLLGQVVAERARDACQLGLHHARQEARQRVVGGLQLVQAVADARRHQAALLLLHVDDIREQPMACIACFEDLSIS